MFKSMKVLVCAGLVSMGTLAAQAQTAQEILHRAAEKLKESPHLRATVSIHGEGSEMFQNMIPKGQASLLLRQVSTDEDKTEWHVRITGESTTGSPREPDPVKIDYIQTPKSLRWIDDKQQTLFDLPPARAMSAKSTVYSAARLLVPTELIQPEPFKAEFDAEELAVLDNAEVNGVECQVIEVTYPKQTTRPGRGARPYQSVKLFFGKDDSLIRRIERIAGAEMYKMVTVLEFADWKVDPELGDDAFEMEAPEGYKLSQSRPVTVTPTITRSVEGIARPAERETRTEESGERFPPAPDFRFTLASGEEVTRDSLNGSTVVLYFWGTWCLECRDYSPQVSTLAKELAEQSGRVFGLAVREKNPAAVKDLVQTRGYQFELSPDGSSAAQAFGVVMFPTFVVIDPNGGLVGTEAVRRNVSPDEVLSRVKALIAKASPDVKLTPQPEPNYSPDEEIP